MRLVVVRHGTARSKHTWNGRDQDRPLTSSGIRQATLVSARLARLRPERLVSSPTLRCVETMTPLASSRHLPIERVKALGTDGGPRADHLLRRLLFDEADSSTIVVCTHREVIEEVLPGLASQFGVRLGHRLPGAKGCCWTLVARDGRLTEVRYWRPAP